MSKFFILVAKPCKLCVYILFSIVLGVLLIRTRARAHARTHTHTHTHTIVSVPFCSVGALDPSSTAYDKDSILKASCALTYLHLMSENNQVNGFLFLVDCTNFTLKHKMFWGLETAKKTMKLMDVSCIWRLTISYYTVYTANGEHSVGRFSLLTVGLKRMTLLQ